MDRFFSRNEHTKVDLMLYFLDGDVRSGKTLLCTILSYKYSKKFPDRPIYSNYKLKMPYFPTFKSLRPEMLVNIKEACLVDIDEIYSWIESRRSGEDINLYMSYILFQSGKRGLDIIITAQLESTFDLRYRGMLNYIIECRKIKNRGFFYSIEKISRHEKYKPINVFLPWKKAEKYFEMYDTLELIDPIDKELIYNVTDDMTDTIKEIDNIVDELLSKADAQYYTRPIIADYCLRNDLPKKFGDSIYNAIKARLLPSKDINKNK